MLSAYLVNFINTYSELIDKEEWRELLQIANKKLNNLQLIALVNVLHETFEALDLSELQWELLYEMLSERIENIKIHMGAVFMWHLIDCNLFGLRINEVRPGLLDDANLEWMDVEIGSIKDYKLLRWRGKLV